jgi:hypothetical protein
MTLDHRTNITRRRFLTTVAATAACPVLAAVFANQKGAPHLFADHQSIQTVGTTDKGLQEAAFYF